MPDDLSAEDRERLVDIKFGELFDRHWERKFGEAFDARVTEMSKAGRKPSSSKTEPPPSAPQEPASGARKRSLLEECFSQALHFG